MLSKEHGTREKLSRRMANVSSIMRMVKSRGRKSGRKASSTAKFLGSMTKEKKIVRLSTMMTSAKATTRNSFFPTRRFILQKEAGFITRVSICITILMARVALRTRKVSFGQVRGRKENRTKRQSEGFILRTTSDNRLELLRSSKEE